MDRYILLKSDAVEVCLRSIAAQDCESLRAWKNAHRHAFFHQSLISPEEQMRWFRAYQGRPDDHMFIVAAPSDVGCMGFRLEEGKIDVYNVIRGVSGGPRRGEMRDALRLMCAYASSRYSCEVGCKVLADNPAVSWYERCGFVKRGLRETYFEMALGDDAPRIHFREEPYLPAGGGRPDSTPGPRPGRHKDERS